MKNPLVRLVFIVLGFISVITLFAYFKSPQNDLGAFAAPSLVAAYLGGVLSIISPCSIAVLPAFFAITFREKQKITRALFVFSLGLTAVFVPLGIGASFLAKAFFSYRSTFLIIAGLFLMLFGILTVFGKSLHLNISGRNLNGRKNNFGTIFFTGAMFAFGTGACAAAIYGGILTLAAAANSIWYGAFLLLIFSAGLMTPLYVLSVYFDKINISENKWLRGKMFNFKILGRDYFFHSTNIIGGLLLIFMGIVFIVWKGTTAFLPFFDKLGLIDVYYNLNETILLGTQGWNGITIIIAVVIFFFLIRQMKPKQK